MLYNALFRINKNHKRTQGSTTSNTGGVGRTIRCWIENFSKVWKPINTKRRKSLKEVAQDLNPILEVSLTTTISFAKAISERFGGNKINDY
jgi:hypothetical protein